MVACVTHLLKLVNNYLLYETVSTVNEERLNLVEGEGKRLTLLPSLSVCNLNPFASDLEKSSGTDFLNVYEKTFDNKFKYQNGTNYREFLMLYERNRNIPSSLFQFGSEKDIQSIAIQKKNFILDCFRYKWMISELILVPCEEQIEVIQLVTAQMLTVSRLGYQSRQRILWIHHHSISLEFQSLYTWTIFLLNIHTSSPTTLQMITLLKEVNIYLDSKETICFVQAPCVISLYFTWPISLTVLRLKSTSFKRVNGPGRYRSN